MNKLAVVILLIALIGSAMFVSADDNQGIVESLDNLATKPKQFGGSTMALVNSMIDSRNNGGRVGQFVYTNSQESDSDWDDDDD